MDISTDWVHEFVGARPVTRSRTAREKEGLELNALSESGMQGEKDDDVGSNVTEKRGMDWEK